MGNAGNAAPVEKQIRAGQTGTRRRRNVRRHQIIFVAEVGRDACISPRSGESRTVPSPDFDHARVPGSGGNHLWLAQRASILAARTETETMRVARTFRRLMMRRVFPPGWETRRNEPPSTAGKMPDATIVAFTFDRRPRGVYQ